MSDYVPEDLMIKIFTRLPIKSILRCTSVCKSWYSLLTSPNFIFTHLNRKQDDHILIQNYVGNSEIYIYALSRYNEKLDQNNHLDYSFKCSNGVVTIVGSCNGIVCIAAADQLNYLNHFYFWNPAIRKPVELPDLGYTCEKCDTFAYALGFGYDHVTNDYKVVRVVHTWSHPSPPHVDLYKLSTGVWEDISHVSLSYLFLATTSQAYVNGASHWIASKWDVSSLVSVIVLFNMHDETFSEMILPSSLINESRSFYDEMFLFVSEESLCLVDNNYDKRKPIDIWMMKEYGAPDTWVKQFSIQNNQFAQHIPLRDDIFWTPYSGNAAPTDFEIANEFLKPMAIRKMVKSYGKVTEDYWFQLIIQVKGLKMPTLVTYQMIGVTIRVMLVITKRALFYLIDGQIIVLEMLVRSHPIYGRESPKMEKEGSQGQNLNIECGLHLFCT